MLKTFTGFKGTAAMVQIGDIKFAILASTPRQLEILWTSLLSQAGPFDPAMCKKAILIEASTLPERQAPRSADQSSASSSPTTTIEI